MSVDYKPAMSREEFDALFGAILASVERWKLGAVAEHMHDYARRPGGKSRNRKQRKPRKPKVNRREEYEKYIKSIQWKQIRDIVLNRDNHKCLCCGDPATEVHHRSYSPAVLDGLDNSKLASICGRCHNKIHYNDDGTRCGKGDTEKAIKRLIERHNVRLISRGYN